MVVITFTRARENRKIRIGDDYGKILIADDEVLIRQLVIDF